MMFDSSRTSLAASDNCAIASMLLSLYLIKNLYKLTGFAYFFAIIFILLFIDIDKFILQILYQIIHSLDIVHSFRCALNPFRLVDSTSEFFNQQTIDTGVFTISIFIIVNLCLI